MGGKSDKKLFIIGGATASGKTAVAIELAKRINGEIISADSMQVYKGMDIGTAKPDTDEMNGVVHHLISIIAPDKLFSAAEFQTKAAAAIGDIFSRGKTPVLAGGTGFYINAVLYGTSFCSENNERENSLRKEFEKTANDKGAEIIHKRLENLDPVYAASIHANNIKRVARALAYCEMTGKTFSAYNETAKKERKPVYDADFYVLSMPRQILYERINARTTAMFNAGFIEEVRGLLQKGYDKGLAAMQGIGYKEVVQFINGGLTQSEAIAAVQQATRRYAKRQETWFRNQTPSAKTLNMENKTPKEAAEEILSERDD